MIIRVLLAGTALMFAGHGVATAADIAGHQHQHGGGTKSGAGAAAASLPWVDGEVRKVDAAGQKLTLRHGPIENLGMGGMTMVFRVKDPAWLRSLKVGDKLRFAVDRVDGNLTVVAVEAAR